MNRSQRMLRLLLATGQRGVCLSEVPSEDRYTARNAVATLRAQGYDVKAEPCKLHGHGASIARYRLAPKVAEPVRPDPAPVVSEPAELFPAPYARQGNAR